MSHISPKTRKNLYLPDIMNWLLEPSAALSPSQRNPARLLMSLVLALIATTIIFQTIYSQINPNSSIIPTIISVAAMIAAYLLCRRGYLRAASIMTIGLPFLGVLQLVISSKEPAVDIDLLDYAVILLLIASVLFSSRGVLFTSFLFSLSMIGLIFIIPSITFNHLLNSPLPFLWIATAILLISMNFRDAIEAQRKSELEEINQSLEQRVQDRTGELTVTNLALVKASKMKDEFMAAMSHELRTPLAGILGFSEALQTKTYGELNNRQIKTLKTIEENGHHLLDLINDVLDLSKIEAGQLELQLAPCSIAELCEASLQLTRSLTQQKHQQLHYSTLIEPIFISADKRRLKQILVNLLSNAVKFTPENGELGLDVQADKHQNTIKFIVWDKGIGIKPQDLHNLFKPFVQIDSSLAREYSGTGLGLSLAQRLAELHNGNIEVESAPESGSRFILTLPFANDHPSPSPHQSPGQTGKQTNLTNMSKNSQSPLVLIADDNEIILDMLADFLDAQSFRVIKIRSGMELLGRAAELHPDIMLVDIQMPGMDGLETLQRIRSHADPILAATPMIAVTALAMPGDRERCLQAGANEYMSKPLKLSELVATIQKQLESKP